MEALLMHDTGHMSPGSEPTKNSASPETRTARAATVFAAIWLALVVASPLIVRYAPSTDDRAMAALATRVEQPRCVASPELGYSCPSRFAPGQGVDAGTSKDL